MPAGRPRKPLEQKRKLGNPGGRPLPDVGSLAVVPALGVEVWERELLAVFDEMLVEGVVWLAATDWLAVALCRDALLCLAELRADPKAKQADVTAQYKMVSGLMGELGFTPASRSRLGLAEVKAASKLDELNRRRGQASKGG